MTPTPLQAAAIQAIMEAVDNDRCQSLVNAWNSADNAPVSDHTWVLSQLVAQLIHGADCDIRDDYWQTFQLLVQAHLAQLDARTSEAGHA